MLKTSQGNGSYVMGVFSAQGVLGNVSMQLVHTNLWGTTGNRYQGARDG